MGRDEDWYVSEKLLTLIKGRFEFEIEKYNNDQAPSSLNSIAKMFSKYVCYATVRNIVIEEFPKYYILIWKSDYGLSTERKDLLYRRLDIEVGEQIPASLSEISRALKISYDMVRYYAKKQYPNSFNDIWGIPQLTADEIKVIQNRYQQEIEKNEKYNENIVIYDKFNQNFDISKNELYKPDPITEIASDLNRSPDTISKHFKKMDPEKYEKIYAKPRLTEEQLEAIISDILCTKMPQTGLAKKHSVSTGTISKISLINVQLNYDDYDHSKRFPHDLNQQLGTAIHPIIECISTEHLLKYDIYKFSEIPYGNYIIDDLLPFIELRKFYDELIKDNEERLSLWKEIGLDIEIYSEIVFDYTSYISKKQTQDKARKYHSPERMILIVGTRWYGKKYPNPIIHTRFKNVKIIRHDFFAVLIGLSGDLLEEFENAIRLNYKYDLEGMNVFKDEITQKYLKLGFTEYKKYHKKQQ